MPFPISSGIGLAGQVQQVVKAIQALDSSQFVSCFSSNGVLIDEAKRHTTAASIQAWFEHGLRSSNASIKVLASGRINSAIWVHVEMDGDYEADYDITEPFPLYLYFFLNNNGKVDLLRINQITPEEPTMRAVWAACENNTDPLLSLRNDVWRVPKAPEGWVRVKVVAAGLNYHDIFTLRGLGMFDLKYPLILGNEATGILDDGTEVIVFPVMGNPDFKGDGTLDPDRHVLGELIQGSLAEYVIIPERSIVKKPTNMSVETASVLGIAWLTAYRMLFTRSGLKRGQNMLVQGSTGGVATALIQLGRAAGMIVWTTGRTEEKRAFALQIGAHQSFPPNTTLPSKAHAVFDMSGEQTFAHSMESVATGGTIVCCGLHSGGQHTHVDLMKLFTEGINIHGTYAGNREEFEALVKFVDEEGIVPYVETALPMEKTKEGLEMLLEGRVRGKVVIKM